MDKTLPLQSPAQSPDWRNEELVCLQRYCELTDALIGKLKQADAHILTEDFREAERYFLLTMLEIPLWYDNLKRNEPTFRNDYLHFYEQVRTHLLSFTIDCIGNFTQWVKASKTPAGQARHERTLRRMKAPVGLRESFNRFIDDLDLFCRAFDENDEHIPLLLYGCLEGGLVKSQRLERHLEYAAYNHRTLIGQLHSAIHWQYWFSHELVDRLYTQATTTANRRTEALFKWWQGDEKEWIEFMEKCIDNGIAKKTDTAMLPKHPEQYALEVIGKKRFLRDLMLQHRFRPCVDLSPDAREQNAPKDSISAVELLAMVNESVAGNLTAKVWSDAKKEYNSLMKNEYRTNPPENTEKSKPTKATPQSGQTIVHQCPRKDGAAAHTIVPVTNTTHNSPTGKQPIFFTIISAKTCTNEKKNVPLPQPTGSCNAQRLPTSDKQPKQRTLTRAYGKLHSFGAQIPPDDLRLGGGTTRTHHYAEKRHRHTQAGTCLPLLRTTGGGENHLRTHLCKNHQLPEPIAAGRCMQRV